MHATTESLLKAEHLSNCMCLELIRHAELAIGDSDPARSLLDDDVRLRVAEGMKLLPSCLLVEGAPLHGEDRTELIGALVKLWDYDVNMLVGKRVKIQNHIQTQLHTLKYLARHSLHTDPTYITYRSRALFALQCYMMTEAAIEAKVRLPHDAPPDRDFFARMLPMVCSVEFGQLLTQEVRCECPNMW